MARSKSEANMRAVRIIKSNCKEKKKHGKLFNINILSLSIIICTSPIGLMGIGVGLILLILLHFAK